ncbi:hypothetical protein GY45DRAFT_1239860 [Cubamyces sp. BRFM 1775]|nr:hypothetical protein GY45DRAFT_1239860 [Cubamyces sp. BRFM 1775]
MSSRPLPPPSASRPTPPAPKTIRLQPKALLSLPHRLAHPPPPQPKASSWGITPHFRIPLDEILDRKHLPPLGLKDFEEWLLFIDRAPENLYFILWLREYTARYSAWARQSRANGQFRPSPSTPPQTRAYRTPSIPHPPPNPALALFYLRAKETFLTPHGPYALRLPHDVLAPFHSSSLGAGVGGPAGGSWAHAVTIHQADALLGSPNALPPPPDPAVFAEVADRVQAILTDSLDRFVVATFHNVGMPRAYCGCAGGTFIGLTGSAPILLANFLTGGSRWWRFTALPGLWLGLTIVISAMFGVCMMIYVFGDLRQLRSFELARVPEVDPVKEKQKDAKHKFDIRVFANSHHAPDSHFVPQPIVGPSPALLPSPTPADAGVAAPQSPAEPSPSRTSRPTPPKLHIVPPQPAHTRAPLHASSIAYPTLARTRSISSESLQYSTRLGKRGRPPCFAPTSNQECDSDDDLCSASGSEYESEYGSDSETDGSSSYSVTDEGMSIQKVPKSGNKRRQGRRRRRREPEIHISDAFFDENPCPEGPATADPLERAGRTSIWGDSSEEDVGTGATFIHPFRWDEDGSMCAHDIESQAHCAAEYQRMDAFDFDGLPARLPRPARTEAAPLSSPVSLSPPVALSSPAPPSPSPLPADPEKSTRVHFAVDSDLGLERTKPRRSQATEDAPISRLRRFLGFIQQKCGPRNVAMQFLSRRSSGPGSSSLFEDEKLAEPRTSFSNGPLSPSSTLNNASVPSWSATSTALTTPPSPTSTITMAASPAVAGPLPKATWQTRVRRMLEVPAFASPLTPVLNPVVTRGQWEIVVRSALIAFVVSIAVIGALVAAPETRVVH